MTTTNTRRRQHPCPRVAVPPQRLPLPPPTTVKKQLTASTPSTTIGDFPSQPSYLFHLSRVTSTTPPCQTYTSPSSPGHHWSSPFSSVCPWLFHFPVLPASSAPLTLQCSSSHPPDTTATHPTSLYFPRRERLSAARWSSPPQSDMVI